MGVKKLHFSSSLIPLVLSGQTTATWRFWDDKDLAARDIVDFLETGTEKHFATAEIVRVVEKLMKNLTDEDKVGHRKFSSDEEMYKTYSQYYKRPVNRDTKVKISWFKLIE